ncbi:MAG: hypothetical protein PSX79_03065, partial [bacterium]|nr:hypothetical protein [bacterium]
AALMALAVGLSACGGGKDVAVVTPPPAAKFEDQFGASFGVAFRADPNSEARDIAAGDVITPSLTAEPVAF